MAIPKITNQNISDALRFIDENGVPDKNRSTQYNLVVGDKKYPPKYVIAVANDLAYKTGIQTDGFNAVEAKNFFVNRGYKIEMGQIKYFLTITRDSVTSTDERFSVNDVSHSETLKPIDVYFLNENGEKIKRNYAKGENKISNQTLPKLAFQIYEKHIAELGVTEREEFPICRYTDTSEVKRGIFTSVNQYHEKTGIKGWEYMKYVYDDGREFVIYEWNMFSTILFVQECLIRWGNSGDKFVLEYRDKVLNEASAQEEKMEEKLTEDIKEYKNEYSKILVESKNIIFRGAPGTGKSYLAKEIAADIISDGVIDDYDELSDEQKKQIEFVQFHPGYDYSDFVEGLRPRINEDGTMGFELQDGVFKRFVEKARINAENSEKKIEQWKDEELVRNQIANFLENIEIGEDKFHTLTNNEFIISSYDDKSIELYIPSNKKADRLKISIREIMSLLLSKKDITQVKDITNHFEKKFATQGFSYLLALYNEINKKKNKDETITSEQERLKKYVFIIDEINRGEIAKIFGELFFAVDPGYRGKKGEVSTQYANLHDDPDEKFYIPKNVYIIGTMNDIDRSVDTFDFAMRRRFRFIEIRADKRLSMLDSLNEKKDEAIERMNSLNKAIVAVNELNENYQIGAAYFKKLETLTYDELWSDCLEPLLADYVRGMYNEKEIMSDFAKAYGINKIEDSADESVQD